MRFERDQAGLARTPMIAAAVGTVAAVTLVVTSGERPALPVGALAYGAVLASLAVLAATRKRSAETEARWNQAAGGAILVACLWGIAAPLAVAIADGFTGSDNGRHIAEMLAAGVVPLTMTAFFSLFAYRASTR